MCVCCVCVCFVFQAEDGIRDLVRSRGLGDLYKRQVLSYKPSTGQWLKTFDGTNAGLPASAEIDAFAYRCLLYTSDAADERSSVDLGGRRIIKKKTTDSLRHPPTVSQHYLTTQAEPHLTQTQITPNHYNSI